MAGEYYIGKRRRRIKGRHLFLIFALGLLLLTLLLNAALYPQVLALAKSRITNRLSSLSAEEICTVLSEEDVRYEDLIRISYGTDGKVTAVSVDTVRLTLLKERIALRILALLQTKSFSVSVPFGNVIGFLPLSEMPGEIPVTVRTAESMRAGFRSSFEEAGINQTRHTISFVFETEVYCLLAGKTERITLSNVFPAAETVIVGEVPDSFTDISRFTDELDEYDIDDAVDFGSVLG